MVILDSINVKIPAVLFNMLNMLIFTEQKKKSRIIPNMNNKEHVNSEENFKFEFYAPSVMLD